MVPAIHHRSDNDDDTTPRVGNRVLITSRGVSVPWLLIVSLLTGGGGFLAHAQIAGNGPSEDIRALQEEVTHNHDEITVLKENARHEEADLAEIKEILHKLESSSQYGYRNGLP